MAFHSNKVTMIMEYQTLEEIYSYYDTKMKIMSALEKRSFEEHAAENDDDEEEVDIREEPVKKVDTKDDSNIHTRIFESDKKSQVQQTPEKVEKHTGSASGTLQKDKITPQRVEVQERTIIEEEVQGGIKVSSQVQEEIVTTITVEKVTDFVPGNTQVRVNDVVQEVRTTEAIETEDNIKFGSDDEDISGMPKLNLEDDE